MKKLLLLSRTLFNKHFLISIRAVFFVEFIALILNIFNRDLFHFPSKNKINVL